MQNSINVVIGKGDAFTPRVCTCITTGRRMLACSRNETE